MVRIEKIGQGKKELQKIHKKVMNKMVKNYDFTKTKWLPLAVQTSCGFTKRV